MTTSATINVIAVRIKDGIVGLFMKSRQWVFNGITYHYESVVQRVFPVSAEIKPGNLRPAEGSRRTTFIVSVVPAACRNLRFPMDLVWIQEACHRQGTFTRTMHRVSLMQRIQELRQAV